MYARAICAASAPVSSVARWTNVVPLRLIMLFTRTVVMISRRKGCSRIWSPNRSTIRGGKYEHKMRWNHGSSGSVESSIRRLRVIFE